MSTWSLSHFPTCLQKHPSLHLPPESEMYFPVCFIRSFGTSILLSLMSQSCAENSSTGTSRISVRYLPSSSTSLADGVHLVS